ncbi:MAG: S-methyl-5'-thioinosine phosphorylase [Candidatus Methylopumilus sp.]
MLGIIGGTGLAALTDLQVGRRQIVRTPYGEPSGPLTFGEISGKQVVFLPRHGNGHTIAPHMINYRANIWALHAQGVRDIVAIATVGGIADALGPGTIALPHQLIDYTHSRKNTYFDGLGDNGFQQVKHIDFTEPYDQALRALCLKAAGLVGEPLVDGGVYAAAQGPRLETAAEINRFDRDGATMVGMTGMPEAALARELEMRYAAICPVANHAAGRGDSLHAIEYEAMSEMLHLTMARVRVIIQQVVALYGN